MTGRRSISEANEHGGDQLGAGGAPTQIGIGLDWDAEAGEGEGDGGGLPTATGRGAVG
jgi:hypothetical protein